jgi:hypothetical protein
MFAVAVAVAVVAIASIVWTSILISFGCLPSL